MPIDQISDLAKLLELGYSIEEAISSIEGRILNPIDLDQTQAKRDGEDWWNK